VSITLHDLAGAIDGAYTGPPALELRGVAAIEKAETGDVTFLSNRKYERFLASTRASAIILGADTKFDRDDVAVIRVKDSYFGFALALRAFHPPHQPERTVIHPSAVISGTAKLGANISVGPCAVIGEGAAVGDRSIIGAGTVLDAGVSIGRDCTIHPNVTILAKARIGDRVIIHAGATIGSDGFGFAPANGRYEKVLQIGGVEIGDDVEIGANCAIDRGALADTVIKRGTKLDNLIQIAHNVIIGEDTVIAAQSGVSGSTTGGDRVLIAGQVGLVGHIDIGDDVTIGAQSGVSKSLHGPGKTFRGAPADEIREELRREASVRRLPELIETVRELKQRLEELERNTGIRSETEE